MKILYFGGQKSGKSIFAEKKTLDLAKDKKPYYIATYDNSFNDEEMNERIKTHRMQRKDKFKFIEEQFNFPLLIQPNQTYIVDCVSMWLFNSMAEKNKDWFLNALERLIDMDSDIVFVLIDVNNGVIPADKESRKFVDLTGSIAQKLVKMCDEVYEVKFGIEVKLK